jgi:hypothetical protein
MYFFNDIVYFIRLQQILPVINIKRIYYIILLIPFIKSSFIIEPRNYIRNYNGNYNDDFYLVMTIFREVKLNLIKIKYCVPEIMFNFFK